MNNSINLSERSLAANVGELSREVVHDFFVVSRKAGIYTVQHPMVKKAVSKPFLSMQKIFKFKKYFCLVLNESELFANNIIVKDIGVSDYIKEKMNELEISSILIEDNLTASDLEIFIERFVKKLATSSTDYFMDRYLENHKVYSIQANSKLAEKLFRTGLRYRNDIGEDHTVRRMVANYFSGDTQLAVDILSSRFESTTDQAAATGIDYNRELVKHILPEKFAQLPPSELLDMAEQILSHSPGIDGNAPERLEGLVKSCDYHPKRDEILDRIREKFIERGIDENLFAQSLSQVGSLKLEAAHAVDNIYHRIFSDDFESTLYSEFHDNFIRLVRTRQMGKAASMAEMVIEQLASDTTLYRQHAIYLLEDIIKSGLSVGEYDFLDVIIRHMQTLFTQGRETFEFSQIVSFLLKSMLSLRRYEPVAAFLGILMASRRVDNGTTVYDSITVKRIFDDLNNDELIDRLICELEQQGSTQIKPVRDILAAIQTDEVAMKLAGIVTHSSRAVRQHSMKVLSELGWPAVKIFSDILCDESNFFRNEGRHELPDKQWFLVRNAIFVMGNLGLPEACNAMRLRLADPDVRVRRELVSALEKIGGDEALDLLMILADDNDNGIREAAIIASGLFKRQELARFFIDLLHRHKSEVSRIITAIALTGSPEGSQFLKELLNDKDRLKSLSSGKASIKAIYNQIESAMKKDEEKLGGEVITPPAKKSALSKTARVFLNKFQPGK